MCVILCVNGLFISWFLHQTTTEANLAKACSRCLSLDSYIKPQLAPADSIQAAVVYLLIPTSNHNLSLIYQHARRVVYLLIPTSNHNDDDFNDVYGTLFISWFLHQTTTPTQQSLFLFGCLSLDSYIKPQPCLCLWTRKPVVYLLIPTSNHNLLNIVNNTLQLFISWFLHQTTTLDGAVSTGLGCLSLDSYIKPQPTHEYALKKLCCLSLDSYIKPQHTSRVGHRLLCCLSLDSYIKPQLWYRWILGQ